VNSRNEVNNDRILEDYSRAVATEPDVITVIKRRMSGLNPALQKIADFIITNPNQCKSLTIKQLSSACDVSESTVTRFVREIGLTNYPQLKIRIAETFKDAKGTGSAEVQDYIYEDISKTDDLNMIFDKLIYRNINMLNETMLLADPKQYLLGVETIEQAENIVFSGIGSSAIAAEEAIMRFTRAGVKCVFPRDGYVQLISSSILNKNDVVIGISNSGTSKTVLDSIRHARNNGIRTIGITAFPSSPLAKISDITLLSSNSVINTLKENKWENTTSKISQLLVIDVLYAMYASRNFDKTKKYLTNTHESITNIRESDKKV
jgi:RpiR family transcriptional regulator, carbohydrate utilization regulator